MEKDNKTEQNKHYITLTTYGLKNSNRLTSTQFRK